MLKFILLGILIVAVMLFINLLLPKLKLKFELFRKEKIKQQNRKQFKKHMKELEIK